MEGVGARLGRSSSRYGPATVFTGPVRKWKKQWIHVTPSSTDHNHQVHHHSSSSSNGNNNNDASSRILLYKWRPIRKTHNDHNSNSNGDMKDENSADEEPPRRKMKYIPIALLEEQNNEAQTDEDIPIENDSIAPEAETSYKHDRNDVSMAENQVSKSNHAELNKSTVGLSLNLNACDDGDGDGDEDRLTSYKYLLQDSTLHKKTVKTLINMSFSSSNLTYRAAIAKPSYPRSYPSQFSLTFNKVSTFQPKSFSVSCVMTQQSTTEEAAPAAQPAVLRPDSLGRFGKFGGKYVPETLMYALAELESAFHALATDNDFQKELNSILRDYVGRETPLYFAERLTEHYKRPDGEGPEIYLKREDLNHTGAHKINNAVAQALLAKKLGKERIIAETGAGQHGVATATVCARFGLKCIIYMGAQDMERQALNVFRMRLLGAEVRAVHSGTATLKDATSEAIRDWVTNVETTHYILGSVAGPHPYPMMVREFHAVIGKETRKQALEKWGGKPDVLVACVGGGSNAMGLFHEFVDDKDVRLIGVEAAGFGLDSGKHAATLTKGEVGVLHGAMSYLLQDDDGQIIEPHSISAGLDYPGVGPEHSFLKDLGRAEYHSITDEEALEAFKRLSRLEGIIPALETSHALAYLEKLCPTLPNGTKVVLNCSGRGDKDVHTAIKHLQV